MWVSTAIPQQTDEMPRMYGLLDRAHIIHNFEYFMPREYYRYEMDKHLVAQCGHMFLCPIDRQFFRMGCFAKIRR